MNVVEINENLTEIDGRVRIESGPTRRTVMATKEILDDNSTAGHYKVGNKDAAGKPIVIGESMTYLDWKASPGYYVYALIEVEVVNPKTSKSELRSQWVEQSFHADKADAAAAVEALLA